MLLVDKNISAFLEEKKGNIYLKGTDLLIGDDGLPLQSSHRRKKSIKLQLKKKNHKKF